MSSYPKIQKCFHIFGENQGERAQLLYNLGVGHWHRHRITGVSIDLETATQRYHESLDDIFSTKPFRLVAGKELLKIYAARQNWAAAYKTALNMVSLVQIARHEESSTRPKSLHGVGSIASDPAAASLSAVNTPYEAIRLLEAFRGIIIESSNEMRIDISDLRQEYPQLVTEFVESRDQLDTSIPFALSTDQVSTQDVFIDQPKCLVP